MSKWYTAIMVLIGVATIFAAGITLGWEYRYEIGTAKADFQFAFWHGKNPAASAYDIGSKWGRIATPSGKPVPCPSQAFRILIFGQSLAGNTGGERFKGSPNTYALWNGKCWPLADPVPGGQWLGGSWGTILATKLATDRPVIIQNAALVATRIQDWNDRLPRYYLDATAQETPASLRPHLILLEIGENDFQRKEPEASYIASLKAVRDRLNQMGITAPIMASISTLHCGDLEPTGTNTVRNAQIRAAKEGLTLLGPDTDKILGQEHRYDGCHPTGHGMQILANGWHEKVAAYLASLH